MKTIVYKSVYDNGHLYDRLFGGDDYLRLSQALCAFKLYKDKFGLPEKTLRVLDLMGGVGEAKPIIRAAAERNGFEVPEVVTQDFRAPNKEGFIRCDVLELDKHVKEKFDLVISIFSGLNCACPFHHNSLSNIIESCKKVAKHSIFFITHTEYWEKEIDEGKTSKYLLYAETDKELLTSLGLPLSDEPYLLVAKHKERFDESDETCEEGEYTVSSKYNIAISQGKGTVAKVIIDGTLNHLRVFDTERLQQFGNVVFHSELDRRMYINDEQEVLEIFEEEGLFPSQVLYF